MLSGEASIWRWLLKRAAHHGITVALVDRCTESMLTDGCWYPDRQLIELSIVAPPTPHETLAHELAHAELGHVPGGCDYMIMEDDAEEYASILIESAKNDLNPYIQLEYENDSWVTGDTQ